VAVGPVNETFRQQDTNWYRECAVSSSPVLRKVAATFPGLPEELVTRLPDDPEPRVRHQLAFSHPLAPPGTVLDAFLAIPLYRPELLMPPGLPRTGLRHLLHHHDPEVRALAAADTTLDQSPTGLLTDPDAHVRTAAAANPLLSVGLVTTLLNYPATAEGTAANPNLPPARLDELLDLSKVPGHDGPGHSGCSAAER
jgi:hypothetical protein